MVVNTSLVKATEKEILELNDDGVCVLFWHVPRSRNKEADALANNGLGELVNHLTWIKESHKMNIRYKSELVFRHTSSLNAKSKVLHDPFLQPVFVQSPRPVYCELVSPDFEMFPLRSPALRKGYVY